jgi:hypothetical protein
LFLYTVYLLYVDQLIILNNNELDKVDAKDKVKDTSSNTNTRCIKQDIRDTSLYNAFTTTESALGPAKATNTPGLEE